MCCHYQQGVCAVRVPSSFADGDAASHFGSILILIARFLACRRNGMERRGDAQLIECVGCLVGIELVG